MVSVRTTSEYFINLAMFFLKRRHAIPYPEEKSIKEKAREPLSCLEKFLFIDVA